MNLNDYEKFLIKKYIEEYGGDYQGYNSMNCSVDYYLRYWKQNKQDLYRLLGDKLTVSKNVVYALSKSELIYNMQEITNHSFCAQWVKYVSKKFFSASRSELFQKNNMDEQLCDYLLDLLSYESLATNRYEGETFSLYPNLTAKKQITINHNCKTIKAIGKLASLFGLDEKEFESFRLAHSLALNQKKLTGKLTLSIHPLDYMTMSDNDCGWDSCVSWQKGGEYRLGTVEMMNSPVAVVAYLESERPMKLFSKEEDVWNNKKWRSLFIVDKRVIIAVKGYPYQHNSLSNTVISWLRELAIQNLGWQYEKVKLTNINYTNIDICHVAMYDDISNMRENYICFGKDYPHDKNTFVYIPYSGPMVCCHCGEVFEDYCDNSGWLVLECCRDIIGHCSKCNRAITQDGDYYEMDDGKLYCIHCYDITYDKPKYVDF